MVNIPSRKCVSTIPQFKYFTYSLTESIHINRQDRPLFSELEAVLNRFPQPLITRSTFPNILESCLRMFNS